MINNDRVHIDCRSRAASCDIEWDKPVLRFQSTNKFDRNRSNRSIAIDVPNEIRRSKRTERTVRRRRERNECQSRRMKRATKRKSGEAEWFAARSADEEAAATSGWSRGWCWSADHRSNRSSMSPFDCVCECLFRATERRRGGWGRLADRRADETRRQKKYTPIRVICLLSAWPTKQRKTSAESGMTSTT